MRWPHSDLPRRPAPTGPFLLLLYSRPFAFARPRGEPRRVQRSRTLSWKFGATRGGFQVPSQRRGLLLVSPALHPRPHPPTSPGRPRPRACPARARDVSSGPNFPPLLPPPCPPCLLQLVRPRAQALCSRSPAAAAWLPALHAWGTRSPRGPRQLHCGMGSRTRDAGALVGAQAGTSIPLTFPGFGDIYLAGTMTRFSGAERDALASVRAAQGRAPRAQPRACGRRSQTGSRGHCEAREAASSPGAATVHAGSPGPVHCAAGSVPRPPSPAVCAEGPWGPAGGRGGRALL